MLTTNLCLSGIPILQLQKHTRHDCICWTRSRVAYGAYRLTISIGKWNTNSNSLLVIFAIAIMWKLPYSEPQTPW